MNLSSDLILRFQEISEKCIEATKKDSSNSFLHYVGNLDEPFSNALTSRLEKILYEHVPERSTRKRFFNAYIEIIQNIRLHGVKDSENHIHGGLAVFERSRKLCADFFNIVSNKQSDLLKRRYEEVNSLSPEELKKRYLDIMLHGDISLKGGAGLGIITIVMKTKNLSPIEIINLSGEFKVFKSHIELDMQ